MYRKVFLSIQNKIKSGRYAISSHAYEEMSEDGFFEEDIIQGIISGKIVHRQRDFHSGEWKYRIHGNSAQDGKKIGVVVKEKRDLVVITVFEEF